MLSSDELIALFLHVCRNTIETPEQLTELLEAEDGFGPRDIFTVLNQEISRMLQDDPSCDTRGEFKLFNHYLAKHGFVYDGYLKRVRGAYPVQNYN